MSTVGESILAVSRMIDGTYPEGIDPELAMRRRIDKIAEEYGEVMEALNGMVGENPRKGFTHTADHLDTELLDVAIAALGALAHRRGNQIDPVAVMAERADFVARRLKLALESVAHA